MTPDISVIVPCFNEAGNLPELVERLTRSLTKKGLGHEVIIVDDGSTDGTAATAEGLARSHPALVRALHHPENRGIEAGWITGLSAAGGRYVCFIDGDLQYQPEDVPRLYREIVTSRADMVQGYRSTIGRLKDARYTLSKGLNFLLNTTFGMRLRDNKSGFVVARRATMEDVLRHRYRYHYFQTFVAVSAHCKGYAVRETETLFEDRLVGRSFIPRYPVRLVARVLLDIVKAAVEFRFGRKQEHILGAFLEEHPPARSDEPLPRWRRLLFQAYTRTMPLHAWMLTRRVGDYYDELKRSQWLSPGQLRALQDIKLRRLLDQAYHHVAYYRELMDDAGLSVDDIRSVDDLHKLPLLSKHSVRENLYFDLLSDNHRKDRILRVTTSGSTGEPFVCYADQHQLELRWAATLRSMEWTGYRFGDRQARLWHQTIGMSRKQVIRERIDAFLSRRLFIPAYEMSENNLAEVLERLRRFRPVLLDGYAESFNVLARYLRDHPVDGFGLKGIVSSAQVLPEGSREVIGSAFGCGVFDKYGSREFSGIAYECDQHAGHHVVAESYVVEVLREGRPARPGEMGEVVVTDLNNLSMPLIRYRIGDLAVAMDNTVPCPCGRGLPRVGRIEGRVQATIITPDGRLLPGTFFAHFFKDYPHLVRQYQILQHVQDSILLRIIKGPRFTEGGFEDLLESLRRVVGRRARIEVEFVSEIPLGRTGKHQGSISTLELDFQSFAPLSAGRAED